MALYQINISYDGTVFHGYQRQFDQRTVQGEVETALRKIGWNERSILSSGRTDAGVHALGQVAAFTLDWKHPIEDLKKAINAHLPSEIAILEINQRTEEDFHPRYSAKSRVYRYQIYTNENRLPLIDMHYWHVQPKPKIGLMQSAALLFIGAHDFSCFGKPYEADGRTERTIKSAQWENELLFEDRFAFTIEANSFLYHMVRRIVFVLVHAGLGKVQEAGITNALDGIDNLPPGIAPARGLYLEKINY